MMRLKHFESALQSVEGFACGDVTLEQYMTPPRIAAQMISVIQTQFSDISDRLVCDLGAGTGMLTIAAIMCGATHVTAIDCDREALLRLIQNTETFDIDRASFDVVCQDVHDARYWQKDENNQQITVASVQHSTERKPKRSLTSSRARPSDRHKTNARNRRRNDGEDDDVQQDDDVDSEMNSAVSQLTISTNASPPSSDRGLSAPLYPSLPAPRLFDSVICNPPFGKRHTGIDMTFVHAALQLTSGAVYSLHKSSTRSYIETTCRQWQVHCDVLYEIEYPLAATYNFHKEKSKVIAVDLIRYSFVKNTQIPVRFRRRSNNNS